ncbi:hypothetical protein [Cellulomonas marina]|uniref:hypothetical protein n=1 Tax=Cellulomonas marina TaxID=988821 RepID=UPI000B7DB9C4|nr:hypothetical protein [Cellulomonas marina]GIG30276.1 hypothetical protein Cma02nite_28760 [Cellulomonas marina]
MDGTPAGYQRFAEEYYETELDADAVSEIFDLRPLTADLVDRLNPLVRLDELADDLAAIDYPRGA